MQHHPGSRLLTLLTICFLFSQTFVLAQSVSGELVGTVYDSTGAAIPNATVAAKNVATGIETTTQSSATGQYRLPNLLVGVYDLTVAASGFNAAQVRNLEVKLNVTATANVTLQVGESKTVVEVTGSSVTIDTTTAQGRLVFHMFGALAEFERSLIRQRVKIGLKSRFLKSSGGMWIAPHTRRPSSDK